MIFILFLDAIFMPKWVQKEAKHDSQSHSKIDVKVNRFLNGFLNGFWMEFGDPDPQSDSPPPTFFEGTGQCLLTEQQNLLLIAAVHAAASVATPMFSV